MPIGAHWYPLMPINSNGNAVNSQQIQSTPSETPPSPDVEILTPPSSTDSQAEIIDATSLDGYEGFTGFDPGFRTDPGGIGVYHRNDLNASLSIARPPQAIGKHYIEQLRDPDVYIFGAQAIQHLRSFCLEYTELISSTAHEEPLVHQFTSHARLQNHIYDGLYQVEKGEVEECFANFGRAFLVLEEVLADVHPMSIAMLLMLLCALKTKQADPIAAKMLKQTLDLAAARPQIPSSLVEALRAIYRSGEILELPLLCLRAASESMISDVAPKWKSFYVKERYCDALYHAHFTGEGSVRRLELLKAQETFYAPSARNVLWTSLNVANDHFIQSRLDAAELQFMHVLQQSDDHEGFHRAKIRVIALSGLVRVALVRAKQRCDKRDFSSWDSNDRELVLHGLRRAADWVQEALDLAEIWFEGSARRTEVIRSLQADVLATSIRAGWEPSEEYEG